MSTLSLCEALARTVNSLPLNLVDIEVEEVGILFASTGCLNIIVTNPVSPVISVSLAPMYAFSICL